MSSLIFSFGIHSTGPYCSISDVCCDVYQIYSNIQKDWRMLWSGDLHSQMYVHYADLQLWNLYLIEYFLNEEERREGRGGRELFLSFKISMWYRFITCFCIFSPVRWFILKRDGCCVICLMVSWEGNRKSYSVLQYLTRHSPFGDVRFSVILYQYPWYFCLFKKILVIFVDKLVWGKNKKRRTTALYMLLIVWQLFFFFITSKKW